MVVLPLQSGQMDWDKKNNNILLRDFSWWLQKQKPKMGQQFGTSYQSLVCVSCKDIEDTGAGMFPFKRLGPLQDLDLTKTG